MNRLFNAAELKLLSQPHRWRVISSCRHKSGKRAAAYLKWSTQHTHVHDQQEVLFVLSGCGMRRYFGQIYPIRAGTVFIADANEPHDYGYPVSDTHGRHLVIVFRDNHCRVRMLVTGTEKTRMGVDAVWSRFYPIEALGLSSAKALFPGKDPTVPAPAVRQRCVNALRLLVASIVEKSYLATSTEYDCEMHFQVIMNIASYIEEVNGKDCQLDVLARRAGYSKFYFSRVFLKYTNYKLKDFVNKTRVEAFQKMRRAGQPMKTIAKALGFRHQSVLSRWRREHGLTQ